MDNDLSKDNTPHDPFASSQIPIMEVHHHPDIHHKRKKVREYLLEFLMIFLAVTLGFFAESLREHLSEDEKAQIYARSMYADFKTDTATLHQLIFFTEQKIKTIDSLDYFAHAGRSIKNDSCLYRCILYLISTFQFDNVNGTYDQVKSSGSLRFFDQPLVNNLNSYDATSLKLKLLEDWENKFLFEKVIPQTEEIFNYKVFDDLRNDRPVNHKMYIKNLGEKEIDILINQAAVISRTRVRQLSQHKLLLQKATDILSDFHQAFPRND